VGQVIVRGYAKINLTLRILFKRDDGYHEIESIMQKIDLYDEVILKDRVDGRVSVCSDNPDIPQHPMNGSLNIATKAAELLKTTHAPERGADVFIRKRIPVAAGLGGGSSDAAACLLGLVRLWGLELGADQLLRLGAEVGSDVPFALSSATAVVGGRGERVCPVNPPRSFWMTLVKPGPSLLAADAYAEFDSRGGGYPGDAHRVLEGISSGDLALLGSGMGNALQDAVERLVPEVGPIMEGLREFRPHSVIVSGSGPTVVAVARDRSHAEAMREAFAGRPGIECATVTQSLR
jgi:4-diphosphocytidyl-2-C-methyl-D-erythritol kinase